MTFTRDQRHFRDIAAKNEDRMSQGHGWGKVKREDLRLCMYIDMTPEKRTVFARAFCHTETSLAIALWPPILFRYDGHFFHDGKIISL